MLIIRYYFLMEKSIKSSTNKLLTKKVYLQIAERISSVLRNCPEVLGVALVGSATIQAVKKPMNLDFLVVTKKPLSNKSLSYISSSLNIFLKCYQDCYSFRYANKSYEMEINITPFLKKDFEEKLNNIIKGKSVELIYKDWAVGLFAPEGFCGDVKEAIVLFDQQSLLKKWRKKLHIYPKKLKKKILKNSLCDLKMKLELFHKAISRHNYLAAQMALSQLLFVIIRLLFALNERYFQGLFWSREKLEEFPVMSKEILRLLDKLTKPENLSSKKFFEIKTQQVGRLIKEMEKLF